MDDYTEQLCMACGKPILPTDETSTCMCGKSYHKSCWTALEKCKSCNSVNSSFDPIFAKYVTNKQKTETDSNLQNPMNDLLSEKRRLKLLHGDGTGLFSNISGKIQALAVFFAIAGAVLGLLTFIAMAVIDEDMILPGLLIGVAIAVVSWVGTFTLYGFGALIRSSQACAEYLHRIMETLDKD